MITGSVVAPTTRLQQLIGQAKQHMRNQQFTAAIPLIQQVLDKKPDHLPTWLLLAESYLGLQEFEAIPPLLSTLKQLSSDNLKVRLLEAKYLLVTEAVAEAETLLHELINSAPDQPRAYLYLGQLKMQCNDPEAAETVIRSAPLAVRDSPALSALLGFSLEMQARYPESLAVYEAALARCTTHSSLNFNLGIAWLRQGNFAQGWSLYESRFAFLKPLNKSVGLSRRWQGEPLAGKHLLVLKEQGLGDTLLSAGYYARLASMAKKLTVEIQPALLELFQRSYTGIDWVTFGTHVDNADLHIPAMSIPGILQEGTRRVFPADPYLKASDGLIAAWKQKLPVSSGLKVGLTWQGSTTFAADHLRSVALRHFAPLATVPGISLFSLQKGDAGKSQLDSPDWQDTVFDVDSLAWRDRNFHDTAAIMQHLDLMITTDTSVAHLAGALGVKTWLILGTFSDWRWFTHPTRCYWYPAMTLWRKQHDEDWTDLLNRMADALKQTPI